MSRTRELTLSAKRWCPWWSRVWIVLCAIAWLGTVSYRYSVGSLFICVGLFLALWGLALAFSHRPYFALTLSTTVLLFFTVLSKAKEFFWNEKLFFADFELFLDPSNTETVLHYPWALVAFLIITLILVTVTVLGWRASRTWMRSSLVGVLAGILGVGLMAWSQTQYQDTWLRTLPKGQNVPTNVVMSTKIAYQDPGQTVTGDPTVFEAAQKTLAPSEVYQAAQSQPLPDIVLLLQESTFNPALYSDITSGLPTLGMFAPNGRQAEGLLRVHTYGGGTWRSEFAALSGLSSDDFGAAAGAVFYSAVFHVKTGLFHELRRYGYDTYVLTPFNPSSYNAQSAYEALGVENIRQPQNYGYPAPFNKNLWHISTEDMLKYAKELLETEPGNKPKAVYVLTMAEHGPYRDRVNDVTLSVTDGVNAVPYENYVSRLKASDKVVVDFENWVKAGDKRRLFVRFGDHQGHLGFNASYRMALSQPQYVTQFELVDSGVNVANDPAPLTDIVYLPGMIVERLQGTPSAFYQANINARRLLEGAYSDKQADPLLDGYRAYLFKTLKVAP